MAALPEGGVVKKVLVVAEIDDDIVVADVYPAGMIDPSQPLPEAAVEAAYCAQHDMDSKEFAVLWRMANEDAPMRGMDFFESIDEVKAGLAAGLAALMEGEAAE